MSPIAIGIVGLIFLFILMLSGVPIGFTMAIVGFAGYVYMGGLDAAMYTIGLVPYSTIASYIFSVFPLFLLMGEFASSSGMMADAFKGFFKWTGNLPGGLAMATIGGCGAFAAVCGSSMACAATMTRICLPEMLRYNYSPKLAAGSIAAGGTLGVLIPPSMGFIIYGLITEQSIGKLFLAGIIPGIISISLFWTTIYILCKRNPALGPSGPAFTWKQKLGGIKDVLGVLIMFLAVMGGIWGGIFTPTEAAAVGVFLAFIFVLLRRRLTKDGMFTAFRGTLTTTGMCFAILIGAMVFNYFIALTGLPQSLADFVAGLPIHPIGILVFIMLIYLVLGCFMDGIAMILLTLPIVFPLVQTMGFNPIWFGVLITVVAEIGAITPPMGINVFVVAGMAGNIPMYEVFRGIIPFFITQLVLLAILIAFPIVSLVLPNTMMGY